MKAIVYQAKPAGWLACKMLSRLWPACRLSGLAGLSLRELPPPPLVDKHWVRCRTLMGGICGTDLAILAQTHPPNSILRAFGSMPMVLGHENLAVVEEVGSAVDRSWLGRRVCVEPTLCCAVRGIDPPCQQCRRGRFGICENFGASGAGLGNLPAGTSIGYNSRTGGSFGEYFVAHRSQLVAVPDALSDELAVLTDPLACALHAVLRADLGQAAQVAVYGAGVMGLSVIACLRATGFAGRIDAIERNSYLSGLAGEFGADEFLSLPSRGRGRFEAVAEATSCRVYRAPLGSMILSGGYDAVFDCVGSAQSVQEALKWTVGGGQVVLVGTGHGGKLDLTSVWFKELTLAGAYGRAVENFRGAAVGTYQLAHELMLAGELNASAMLTHTFRIEQYRQAFQTAMDKAAHGAVKVAFDFRSRQ